jgi:hypothetical protein
MKFKIGDIVISRLRPYDSSSRMYIQNIKGGNYIGYYNGMNGCIFNIDTIDRHHELDLVEMRKRKLKKLECRIGKGEG